MIDSKKRKRIDQILHHQQQQQQEQEDDDVNSSSNDSTSKPESITKTKKNKKELNGVVSSLLLLDDQARQDRLQFNLASHQHKSDLDSLHATSTKTMIDYFSGLQNHYDDIQNSDSINRANSRLSTTTTITASAAVIATEAEAESKERKPGKSAQNRRLWVKDRSSEWWEECNRPDYPDEDFRRAFRMGKSTFDKICQELNSVIAKEDTTLRNAIPVRQRVAVCLWRLATGEPLRLVSKRFGLGISTCHKLVLEVCTAIKNVLMPKYLQWPDDESINNIKDEFESLSGIPNVVGSMYTTHIPIIAPKVSVAAYFNKRHTERNHKTSYSITLQGVVDSKGVFTDVCIGWPGSMSDDQVVEKSALYQRANNGLLSGMWIVGGLGFPLMDWIMVPYTQQHLTWTQHAFNEKIGEIQKVSRDAFGKLKGRWSCLQKRTEIKLQELPAVLGACCVLHNICEMNDESIDPQLMTELDDDEIVPEVVLRSMSSVKARDVIAHNLLHHGLAGTSFL